MTKYRWKFSVDLCLCLRCHPFAVHRFWKINYTDTGACTFSDPVTVDKREIGTWPALCRCCIFGAKIHECQMLLRKRVANCVVRWPMHIPDCSYKLLFRNNLVGKIKFVFFQDLRSYLSPPPLHISLMAGYSFLNCLFSLGGDFTFCNT